MRIAFVEWPEDLKPEGPAWAVIVAEVADARADLLISNELPFGPWIAAEATFDAAVAQSSVDAHIRGLAALAALPVPAVLTSRPVWVGSRLANEAVAIEDGQVRPLHRKRFFPAEPGWHETSWYESGIDDFPVTIVGGVGVGVLLCTEAMFNEHARSYGRKEATLIAIPRATGDSSIWRTAGQMAAIVSGCYVVSSNRVGASPNTPTFAGDGFAYAPDGRLMSTTDAQNRVVTIDIDPALAARQRTCYPCYVSETPV